MVQHSPRLHEALASSLAQEKENEGGKKNLIPLHTYYISYNEKDGKYEQRCRDLVPCPHTLLPVA